MSEAILAPSTRFAERALTLGTPRFSDARLASLARTQGDAAAWQAALAQGAAAAAASADGDFAVGLSDGTGRTFLAVDRFAIRTLCYRVIEGQLHFAARADELAALPPRAAIDPQAIFDYLYFHVIPSPRTVFQGVYRLPPAHCALFEGGRLTVTPYWVPRFTEPGNPEFAPLAAEFRQLVRNAVATQLDGSKPACFLSGGTDSSTVAGMIGEVAGRPAATYSIGFEAEGYDEMQYARIAAKRFGTEHHEYYVTPDDLVRSIPAVAAHYDQPFGNSSALPAYYCAKMAREDGVTKLLAGDGGDELFGGNARYAKQRVFGCYDSVPAAAAQGLARTPAGAHAAGHAAAGAQGPQLRGAGQGAAARPHADVQPAAAAEPGAGVHPRLPGPGRPGRPAAPAARRMAADARRQRRSTACWPTTGATRWPRPTCPRSAAAQAWPACRWASRSWTRRWSTSRCACPATTSSRGRSCAGSSRKRCAAFCPTRSWPKKKQGFGLPFGVWANRHDGLRRFATDALQSLAGRGIVQPAFIATLLKEHLPAHPGYYGEMVWILMMLEQWMRAQTIDTGRWG